MDDVAGPHPEEHRDSDASRRMSGAQGLMVRDAHAALLTVRKAGLSLGLGLMANADLSGLVIALR